MIAAMDPFGDLIGTSSPAVAALRALGVKVAGTRPPVREAITLHAMDVEGDLPGEVRPARA